MNLKWSKILKGSCVEFFRFNFCLIAFIEGKKQSSRALNVVLEFSFYRLRPYKFGEGDCSN